LIKIGYNLRVTAKEIVEFSNKDSMASEAMKKVVQKLLENNPDLSYIRINCDDEPDLVKTIIASQPPTVSPFFVSFKDGKMSKSLAGIASVEDLEDLIK
jgi:thioredoxin-like negative regulator of GroEL